MTKWKNKNGERKKECKRIINSNANEKKYDKLSNVTDFEFPKVRRIAHAFDSAAKCQIIF